ncbi:MAG: GNAT family N-acetyltransferase [Acidobacteriota bacterium]
MPPGQGAAVVDLPAIGSAELAPLLEEEKARWLRLLHWDFSPLAELILRYAAMGTLEGFALKDEDRVAGYAYYVTEGGKGLIGDLYVLSAWRSPAHENLLLNAVLDRLRSMPWLRRVEAQLMHLGMHSGQIAPAGRPPAAFPRQFMLAPLDVLPESVTVAADLHFERWSAHWTDAAAEVIAEAYAGHVDSEINNQYRSAAGARRFIENIVRYPGCGYCAPDCTWVALNREGRIVGVCFTSRIAPATGHIAQICVIPAAQGCGAGAELLRRSLHSLRLSGATEASLTVTSSNTRAVRLYEAFGFRPVHHFEALVWEPL